MQHLYAWGALDNLMLVAVRTYVAAGFPSWVDLADQIIQQNFPTITDPVTAVQLPDGTWTSGIRPGTVIVIPYA